MIDFWVTKLIIHTNRIIIQKYSALDNSKIQYTSRRMTLATLHFGKLNELFKQNRLFCSDLPSLKIASHKMLFLTSRIVSFYLIRIKKH